MCDYERVYSYMNFKKQFLKNKNNKFLYYVTVFLRELTSGPWHRWCLSTKIGGDLESQPDYISDRVNYYNRLVEPTQLSSTAISIADYHMPKKIRVYYFDSKEYLRFFNPKLRFELLPGDVIHVPSVPTFVKSRPIAGDNQNAVILKLDKTRHFNFLTDEIAFRNKKNMLVGRSEFAQEHRKRFFDLYVEHRLCDLKKSMRSTDPDFLSIEQHLNYKFILALEGNDVATNLKWIMSSNSIAVMPPPTYETWFMEGRLLPNYHYICIRQDYADLDEKLTYYIDHPEEAENIVKNANQYVQQFKNGEIEDRISLLVMQKYFRLTNSLS